MNFGKQVDAHLCDDDDALTGCDNTSSINRVGKSKVFKKISNKHLQDATSVLTASSKLHEEIESAGKKKQCLLFSTGLFPQFPL